MYNCILIKVKIESMKIVRIMMLWSCCIVFSKVLIMVFKFRGNLYCYQIII